MINNTLPNLVEDMEKIRIFLGIEKWLISGGGWGATAQRPAPAPLSLRERMLAAAKAEGEVQTPTPTVPLASVRPGSPLAMRLERAKGK